MNARAPRAESHVPELDGIRGIAILMVMGLHFVCTLVPPVDHSRFEFIAARVTGYGAWGVDLFFVLSGYLITGILWDSRGKKHFFRTFYARRTLRIFPLYYAVLLLATVILPAGWLLAHAPEALEIRHVQGWLWPYLTNVYIAKQGSFAVPYLSHFWTLAIEEHFYLFWPFVVGLLPRKAVMRTCVALSALSLVLRLAAHCANLNIYCAEVLTPFRLDALCIGAWLALAARGPGGLHDLAQRAKAGLIVASAGVLSTSLWHTVSGGEGTVSEAIRGLFLALFFGCLIVLVSSAQGPVPLKSMLRLRALQLLGKYSYGLYVFHGILAFYLGRHGTLAYFTRLTGSQTVGLFLQALLASLLSTVVAVLSYELFEVHFLRLKKLFPSAPGAPREAAAPAASLVGPSARE
jgi:peptidoglycan/LPS O-acetylase OafA/YrhL